MAFRASPQNHNPNNDFEVSELGRPERVFFFCGAGPVNLALAGAGGRLAEAPILDGPI